MKNIIENIANLIDLKSIITLIVGVAYTFMVFTTIVQPDYNVFVIMILTYYVAKPKTEDKK
jgi:hypothetical protein